MFVIVHAIMGDCELCCDQDIFLYHTLRTGGFLQNVIVSNEDHFSHLASPPTCAQSRRLREQGNSLMKLEIDTEHVVVTAEKTQTTMPGQASSPTRWNVKMNKNNPHELHVLCSRSSLGLLASTFSFNQKKNLVFNLWQTSWPFLFDSCPVRSPLNK